MLMDEETKLYSDVSRADKAASLLNNEIFKEAFFKLEESYIHKWRNTDPKEAIMRERLWAWIQQLTELRNHFEKIIADGKLATFELNRRYGKKAA